MLGQTGEEPLLHHAEAGRIDPHLVIGRGHDSQSWYQRIDPQLVAPAQLDMGDDTRELLDAMCRRGTAREDELTFRGQKEDRGVGEMPSPRGGTVAGGIARHGCGERPDAVRDRGIARRFETGGYDACAALP